MLLSFGYFLLVIIFAFFFPGSVLLRPVKIPTSTKIILSFLVGMTMWAWQGFVFGMIGTRLLSYPYLLFFAAAWLFYAKNSTLGIPKINISWQKILLILLIICGSAIQVANIWYTGAATPKGTMFCCGNVSDSIYYASLTKELVSHIPPSEPGMAGTIVHNYHYWSNIVIADLIRIFNLPLFATQFQFMALFVSLFLGLSALAFSDIAKLSKTYTLWLVFFLYFGSDLIYLFVSILRHEINFKMSALEHGGIFLLNPPRAFSILVLFAGICLLQLWIQKKNTYLSILMAFIFASLFGFKVYTGIFAVVGLFFLGLYNFVKKREKKSILLFTATVILGLIIYLPVNSQAGGLYFSRFYIFENFIVQPWMALDRLELTRQVYVDHHNIPRIMEYELLYIVLYVITVFGFKNLAFFQTKKSLSYFNTELHLFLGGGLFISAILGFFFQQSTGGSNTFNFLTLVFIISSFYTALACWYWLSRFPMAISVLATVSIILLSLPRIGNDFVNNVQSITQYKTFIIPSPEMQALEFLKINGDKQKLVFIPDPNKDKDGKDLYITIYTNMPMFLSAQRILESHGIQTAQREKIQQALINTASPEAFLKIARKNNIGYMYIRNTNSIPMLRKQTLLPIIYENKFGTIYKL